MKKIYTTFIILCLSFGFAHMTQALTVSPAILELSSDPGTTVKGTIKLFNETEKNQTFYTSSENFEPSDDSGAPKFFGNDSNLATWVSMESSVILSPKEEREIPFSITIPSDIEPGGYFAAIFFGTQPPANEGGKVSIGGRLGVLTFLRVNGDIPEDGGLLEFHTKDSQFFYDMPPVAFEYRFSNDGGDRVIPKGSIKIKNTFGSKKAEIKANPTDGNVLPGSARCIKPVWSVDEEPSNTFFEKVSSQWKNFHFGYYTAELNIGWGFTNQTTTDAISFLIIPWQLIIVSILTLGLGLFFLKFIAKMHKKALLKEISRIQEKEKEEDIETEEEKSTEKIKSKKKESESESETESETKKKAKK